MGEGYLIHIIFMRDGGQLNHYEAKWDIYTIAYYQLTVLNIKTPRNIEFWGV